MEHRSHRVLIAAALLACVVTTDGILARQRPATNPEPANPHSAEPIGSVREIYDGALTQEVAVNTFRNIDRLFATRVVRRSQVPSSLPSDSSPLGIVRIKQGNANYDLEQYIQLNRVTALLVIKDGRIKLERYRFGNTEHTRWMSMSVAKSITSTLLGAALKQGLVGSVTERVTKYVPALAGSAYEDVTIRDVLMMSSGVRWDETYTDPKSDRRRLLEAQISQVPGSAMSLMKALPRASNPGTVNNYNTGETQVVAEIVRSAVTRPLADYLSERIWSRVGMEADATWWLDSPGGIEIGGSGISATLRDYGRFGLFLLSGGVAAGESILPDGWLREATSPKVLRGGAPLAYGYLWWTPLTAQSLHDAAYMARGTYGQRLYINPTEKVVTVIWSARPGPTTGEIINDWAFCDAVVEALR